MRFRVTTAGLPSWSSTSASSGFLGGAVGVGDRPERRGLWRRRLRVEAADVALSQEGGHVAHAAVPIIGVQPGPVTVLKVAVVLSQIGPGDEMPAVIRW